MRFHLSAAFFFASIVGFAAANVGRAQVAIQNELPAVESKSSELVRAANMLSSQANYLNQNQWVRLTEDGILRGSVNLFVAGDHVPQANVQVALVHDGRPVAASKTDVEGDFMIEKASPGNYSLVVEGENQLAVYALTVLSADAGSHLPGRVHVRTVAPNTARVNELLRSNTMPSWTVGVDMEKDPIADVRKFADSCEIAIDSKGGISGVLSRSNARVDLGSTVVYLMRDGRDVARTRAASNGAYRFDGVAPGSYGLVASGPEGIAAVGFCAVTDDIASQSKPTNKLISTRTQGGEIAPAASQLNVELAEPNCYVPAEVIPGEELAEAACCPTMGGCCGGGSTGGGGGGGGSHDSGMGAWVALATVGALAAYGISQDNNNNDQAPIVSPVSP